MSAGAIELAKVASRIQTVADVRAAMGAVTVTLSQAYAQLPNISSIAGEQDAARSLLDTVNKSAGILYNIYSDDPDLQDEDITAWHAHSAGVIMSEANDALTDVEQAVGQNLWDIATIVDNGLAIAGNAAGSAVQSVTNAVAAGASAFVAAAWPTLLIVAGGVGVFIFRRQILAALSKAGG